MERFHTRYRQTAAVVPIARATPLTRRFSASVFLSVMQTDRVVSRCIGWVQRPQAAEPRYSVVPCYGFRRIPAGGLSAGRKAVEAAAPIHVALVRKWFIDALTPAQLDSITEMSASVIDRLTEGQVAPDPRGG